MIVAVTSPAGHIGRAVAENLLEAGVGVRLLACRPDKVADLVERGAKVVQGSLEDAAFLPKAIAGVRALCWVTPASFDSDDVRATQVRLAQSAAKAMQINQTPRVVNVSSVGAHLGWGTGLVNGLHDVEQILDDAATSITHLRPGYFYENYFWQLDSMVRRGSVFLPVSGSARYPMIATPDVARVAADRLLDPSWTGFCVRELHGPADLSFNQAVALLSEALGRKVVHVKVGPEQAIEAMQAAGMSEDAAELMVELYRAIDSGLLRPNEPRSIETSTPTTLLEFAREAIAPLVQEPVS